MKVAAMADMYFRLGRLEEAFREGQKHLKGDPDFSLTRYAEVYPLKHPYRDKNKARKAKEEHIGNLREIGLPD